jgi:Phosphoinositide phospholipase C, Ca2+-dependent
MRSSTFLTRVSYASIALGLALTSSVAPAGAGSEPERIDDLRMLGTHNSYHVRPARELVPGEPADYAHLPVDEQLDLGIRSLELDAYNAGDFPVSHSLLVDDQSTCLILQKCLRTVARWSRDHPQHEPLVLFFEPKLLPTNSNPSVQAAIDAAATEKGITSWDAAGLDRIDTLVRGVFGRSLITPDQVRGNRKTLRDAVRADGWPTVKASRGKVLVTLIGEPELRDLYKAGAPSLEGRAMFVDSNPREPSAAVLSMDVPEPARFARLLPQHFLIKTRADADGKEARANDHTRADAAIASGAQIIVTDYPVADPTIGPYVVTLP